MDRLREADTLRSPDEEDMVSRQDKVAKKMISTWRRN